MRKRGAQGGARLDRSELRRMVLENTPMQTALGIVRLFPGESSHFEIQINSDTGQREVLVDVELIPRSEKVLCRLGFGQDTIYRIPRVNQEVAVLIPMEKNSLVADELDGNPIIVAILDSGIPDALDSDDIVVIDSPRVKIHSPDVEISDNGGGPQITVDSNAAIIKGDDSSGAAVEVTSSTVKIGGGASPHEPTIKATTYRSAEDLFLAALTAYVTAIQAIADPLNVASPLMTGAITTFTSAASAYLTTIAKVR
jgi:hypothetical protein